MKIQCNTCKDRKPPIDTEKDEFIMASLLGKKDNKRRRYFFHIKDVEWSHTDYAKGEERQ